MLSDEDLKKITKVISELPQPQVLDERTRIGLGHVVAIVVAVVSLMIFVSKTQRTIDASVTMDYERTWRISAESLNPGWKSPDPDKVKRESQ